MAQDDRSPAEIMDELMNNAFLQECTSLEKIVEAILVKVDQLNMAVFSGSL